MSIPSLSLSITSRLAEPAGFAAPVAGGWQGVCGCLRLRFLPGLRGMARLVGCAVLLAFALPAATMATYGAGGQDAVTAEYQLKAAFLYNFAKFVEWPAETDRSADSFTFCVAGEESFRIIGPYLAGKKVRGRMIVVRAAETSADTPGCHLLFVSAASIHLQNALRRISGPVLTVGESTDFISSGGMINLIRENNRLRFEIARSAGERNGLKFRSQLLELAAPAGSDPRQP